MAVLEKIRSKSVLLLVVIGVALLAFIIGDFLNSGRSFFGAGTTVAKVDGKKISITDFQRRYEEYNQQLQASNQTVDGAVVQNRVLQDMVTEQLLNEEVEALGIDVTDAEITEAMTGQGAAPAVVQMARQLGLESPAQLHDLIFNPGKYGAAIALVSAIEAGNLQGPLWVCMGDNFIWNPDGETASEAMVRAIEAAQAETGRTDVSAMLGVEVPREEVSRYGVLSVDANGNLTGIVEKPSVEVAPSNLISPGYYVFSPRLVQLTLDYVHNNDFGPGDQEYLVPDPIAHYIAEGGMVRTVPATGEYLDGGNLEGWLHANEVVCATLK